MCVCKHSTNSVAVPWENWISLNCVLLYGCDCPRCNCSVLTASGPYSHAFMTCDGLPHQWILRSHESESTCLTQFFKFRLPHHPPHHHPPSHIATWHNIKIHHELYAPLIFCLFFPARFSCALLVIPVMDCRTNEHDKCEVVSMRNQSGQPIPE